MDVLSMAVMVHAKTSRYERDWGSDAPGILFIRWVACRPNGSVVEWDAWSESHSAYMVDSASRKQWR